MTCETAISIKEITHYFGEKKVLAGISFSVEKGEILGLLGPSGAGKTTLIRIMTGQLPRRRAVPVWTETIWRW